MTDLQYNIKPYGTTCIISRNDFYSCMCATNLISDSEFWLGLIDFFLDSRKGRIKLDMVDKTTLQKIGKVYHLPQNLYTKIKTRTRKIKTTVLFERISLIKETNGTWINIHIVNSQ